MATNFVNPYLQAASQANAGMPSYFQAASSLPLSGFLNPMQYAGVSKPMASGGPVFQRAPMPNNPWASAPATQLAAGGGGGGGWTSSLSPEMQQQMIASGARPQPFWNTYNPANPTGNPANLPNPTPAPIPGGPGSVQSSPISANSNGADQLQNMLQQLGISGSAPASAPTSAPQPTAALQNLLNLRMRGNRGMGNQPGNLYGRFDQRMARPQALGRSGVSTGTGYRVPELTGAVPTQIQNNTGVSTPPPGSTYNVLSQLLNYGGQGLGVGAGSASGWTPNPYNI